MVFPFSKWGNRVFWGIVFAALAFLILGFGLRFYYDWHDRKQIEQMAKNLDQFEKDRQAAMAADTIGGQTPQET
ncbi:hypothetical protein KKB69_03195, partial [Patescibacteria group bacterium]|nr:hypothetical protein [Patescibacteria group bacterium]